MLNKISSALINDSDTSPTESTLLHPYPGSMPAFLASRLIDSYSNKDDYIIDPFCGSGSVINEGLRLKRNCIGAELLELPIAIAKSAINLPDISDLLSTWENVKKLAMNDISLFKNNNYEINNTENELSKWLHPETLAGVLSIRKHANLESNNETKVVIAIILSGALLSLSKRVSRGVLHWGWIADNVIPKKGDLFIVDPFKEVEKRIVKLARFKAAVGNSKLTDDLHCEVLNIDWLNYNDELNGKEFDLLITSPPYPYSIDYALAQRLSSYLFNIDISEIRKNEIGARYKRKRKFRTNEYLSEIRKALHASSKYIKINGKAVFVLPHPDEYKKVLNLSIEEWIQYINDSLAGEWSISEYGVRDCIKRRVVHSSVKNRQEVVLVCQKNKNKNENN